MGRSRYRVLEQAPHFLTCTIVDWLPLFSQPTIAQIVIDSLLFLHNEQRLILHAYVIMENHLHLIATSQNLPKAIQTFKSFTARTIIDTLNQQNSPWLLHLKNAKQPNKVDQEYQVWQPGFHPQAIQSDTMLLQKLEYIHNNPVKRGYVDEPSHWRYSSNRLYKGQSGILPIECLS
jgi:REP element-mobilizing transposase RayT